MDTPPYDILIQGAGPVGSALALMFARNTARPSRIALAGPLRPAGRAGLGACAGTPAGVSAVEPPGKAVNKPAMKSVAVQAASTGEPDPRTLALNHGSRALLEQLGAWPQHSADIHFVHVSQRGRLGRTLISHAEMNVPRLGSVVAYDALVDGLHHALRQSGVTLLDTSFEQPLAHEAPVSRLSVLSDGGKPKGVQRQYGQHALLATIRAGAPLANWAFERFTREGPLAVLPHPQGPDYYGIVWCGSPTQTAGLQQLSQDAFSQALTEMFGARLGHLSTVGERHVFPLSMHAGPSLLDDRTIAVGNAAQTLHPVAGQGLNLGLRDAMQLSLALTPWLGAPEQDGQAILRRYAQQRRADRLLTAGLTDFLPRIFATGNPLVEHACGLALMALDATPPMRHALSRQLLQGMRA